MCDVKLPKRSRKRVREVKRKARPELGTKESWSALRYAERFDEFKKFTDNVERIRESDVSCQSFIEKYEKPYQPVVIQEVQKYWPANEKWTLQRLTKKYRNQKFKCGEDNEGYSVKMKMKYYVQYMQTSQDDSPLYIFDSSYVTVTGASVGSPANGLDIDDVKLLPDFDDASYDKLGQLVAGKSQIEREVVLSSDEMRCVGGLVYDPETDRNLGGNIVDSRERNLPVEGPMVIALFVISGLRSEWSYVVGYSVVCRDMRAADSTFLFAGHLERLQRIGLRVKVVLTDMLATSKKGLKSLEEESKTDPRRRFYVIHCMEHLMDRCAASFNSSRIYMEKDDLHPACKGDIVTLEDRELRNVGVDRESAKSFSGVRKPVQPIRRGVDIFFSEACVRTLETSTPSTTLQFTTAFIGLMRRCVEATSGEESSAATRASLVTIQNELSVLEIHSERRKIFCFKILYRNIKSIIELIDQDPNNPIRLQTLNNYMIETCFANAIRAYWFRISTAGFIKSIGCQAACINSGRFHEAVAILEKRKRQHMLEAARPAKGVHLTRGIFYSSSCDCTSEHQQLVVNTLQAFEDYEDHRLEHGIGARIFEAVLPNIVGGDHRECRVRLVRHLITELIVKDNEGRTKRL